MSNRKSIQKFWLFVPLMLILPLIVAACGTPTSESAPPGTSTLAPLVTTAASATTAVSQVSVGGSAANPNNGAAPAIPAQQPAPGTVAESNAVIGLVEKVNPAVVTVYNKVQVRSGFRSSTQTQGVGSGFIISQDGYIVTNYHVVEGQQALEVAFNTGENRSVGARLVGGDPSVDLAVLKVDGGVPAFVNFGDSGKLRVGETVVAIGSALGDFRNSVTKGIISGLNRSVGNELGLVGMIQTDASINSGNSGGPLFNLNGEVVGVNTAVVRGQSGGVFGQSGSAPAEGLGFAIPSSFARQIVDRIINGGNGGQVNRPYLGIEGTALNPSIAAANDLPVTYGVFIQNVLPGTPAANAGLQQGDIVTAINGKRIEPNTPLARLLLDFKPGDQVTATVYRDGREGQVRITLGQAPR
jgi:2-alkenal reductase